MKIITESEINFGKFDETDLFHIEDSKIYKEIGSGIKTVEFILNNCASHSRYFSDELDAQIFL